MKILIFPFAPPEKESHSAGAGMAADGRADAVDLHFAIEIGEILLHQIGYRPSILIASRLGDIAFAIIILPSFFQFHG